LEDMLMLATNSRTRRRLSAILLGGGLGALLVLGVTGWLLLQPRLVNTASSPDSQLATGPLATVNGVVITQNMVDREVNVSRFNLVAPPPKLAGPDLERARQEALNQLITRQIVLQAAIRQGFVLDNAHIQQQVDLLFGGYGEAALTDALKQAGVTAEDLFWWVSELTTVEEFTVQVVMANTAPENRQRVYNAWLNEQQAGANVQMFTGAGRQFTVLPGNPAPDFTLSTLDGRPVSLSDYRGQVVLINFWATWCPSCIAEMPAYEAVYRERPPGEFMVLGVNLQEEEEYVQRFSAGLGLTFPILLDSDGQVTIRDYQVVGMPGSIIIDRQGAIFYRHLGPMSDDLLRRKLAELN
jgi:peroxiredoxin